MAPPSQSEVEVAGRSSKLLLLLSLLLFCAEGAKLGLRGAGWAGEKSAEPDHRVPAVSWIGEDVQHPPPPRRLFQISIRHRHVIALAAEPVPSPPSLLADSKRRAGTPSPRGVLVCFPAAFGLLI